MHIGICGVGFVGNAVKAGFAEKNSLYLLDPKLYPENNVVELLNSNPDAIFICVPAPTINDGEVNTAIVDGLVKEINAAGMNYLVVIKSTIPPSALLRLKEMNKKVRLVHNPEFLTERNAIQDFLNPTMHILGGDAFDVDEVEKIYYRHSSCNFAKTYKTDIATAAMVKYSINSFLASKVLFMNQLYDIFNKSGAKDSWANFTTMLSADKRFGSSHLKVPGLDDLRGFGGTCFPKDTEALAYMARKLEVPFTVLEEVIKANKDYRSEKK